MLLCYSANGVIDRGPYQEKKLSLKKTKTNLLKKKIYSMKHTEFCTHPKRHFQGYIKKYNY